MRVLFISSAGTRRFGCEFDRGAEILQTVLRL